MARAIQKFNSKKNVIYNSKKTIILVIKFVTAQKIVYRNYKHLKTRKRKSKEMEIYTTDINGNTLYQYHPIKNMRATCLILNFLIAF